MGSPDYINWPTNGPYFDMQNPLAQGCVGAWCFNPSWWAGTSLYDLSGYHHNGVFVGGAPVWSSWGNRFDGNVRWDVSSPTFNALPATYKFTIGLVAMVAGSGNLLDKAAFSFSGVDDINFYPYDSTGGNRFRIYWSNLGGNILSKIHGLAYTGPHHFILTSRASNDHRIYMDGILADTSADTGTAGPFSNTSVGSAHLLEFFPGTIAECSLWNRALSDSEIAQYAADPLRLFRRKEIAYFFGAPIGGVDYSRTIDDNVGISDAIARTVTFERTEADNVGIADAFARTMTFERTEDDSVGIADSIARAMTFERTEADNVGATDAFARTMTFARTQDDSVGIADSIARAMAFERTEDDAVGITDAIARVLTFERTIADAVGITDIMATPGIMRLLTLAISIAQAMDLAGATDTRLAQIGRTGTRLTLTPTVRGGG